MNQPINILFVCSKNQWRSPTAEQIYKKIDGINVRSAGINSSSRHQISIKDIEWADLIFAMEDKHKSSIRTKFKKTVDMPKIDVLDIPDDYKYMNPELIQLLKESIDPYLESLGLV